MVGCFNWALRLRIRPGPFSRIERDLIAVISPQTNKLIILIIMYTKMCVSIYDNTYSYRAVTYYRHIADHMSVSLLSHIMRQRVNLAQNCQANRKMWGCLLYCESCWTLYI